MDATAHAEIAALERDLLVRAEAQSRLADENARLRAELVAVRWELAELRVKQGPLGLL